MFSRSEMETPAEQHCPPDQGVPADPEDPATSSGKAKIELSQEAMLFSLKFLFFPSTLKVG